MKRFSRRNIIAVVGNTAGEVAVWDIPGIANIDHASLPDSPKCVYHGNQLGTNSMSIAFKRSGMSPIIVVATGGDDQAISCSILRLTLKDDASLQSPSVVLEQLIMAHESCASAIKGLHIVQDVHSQLRLYAVGYDQRLSLWSVDLKADCIPRLNFVSSTLVDIKDINCLGYATQHGQHGEETDCIVAAGEGIEVFSFPINIWNAAQAFMKCDYLLITCGAGFSADSGLSTYETMPDTYRELCNPLTLVERQRDFQLFWSRFAQKYRETLPHRGYNILEQWCFGGYLVNLHRKQEKRFEISPWWIYSSNVDGHFNRFSCFSETICEIHGCATDFRCSFAMGYSNNKKRFGLSWDQWNEQVENQKRFIQSECADSTFPVYVLQSGIICKNCSLPARPNVLLFHDTDDNMLKQINESRERYQYWESMMEDEIVYNNKHLVILELGAGLNVPAVRNESEEVFMDTWHRINELASKGSATLIRINPKDAQCHHLGNDHLISIFKKAESTLLKINQIVMYISRNNKIY
jgi:NAD-dependent SIR2 family protein deacetylase